MPAVWPQTARCGWQTSWQTDYSFPLLPPSAAGDATKLCNGIIHSFLNKAGMQEEGSGRGPEGLAARFLAEMAQEPVVFPDSGAQWRMLVAWLCLAADYGSCHPGRVKLSLLLYKMVGGLLTAASPLLSQLAVGLRAQLQFLIGSLDAHPLMSRAPARHVPRILSLLRSDELPGRQRRRPRVNRPGEQGHAVYLDHSPKAALYLEPPSVQQLVL